MILNHYTRTFSLGRCAPAETASSTRYWWNTHKKGLRHCLAHLLPSPTLHLLCVCFLNINIVYRVPHRSINTDASMRFLIYNPKLQVVAICSGFFFALRKDIERTNCNHTEKKNNVIFIPIQNVSTKRKSLMMMYTNNLIKTTTSLRRCRQPWELIEDSSRVAEGWQADTHFSSLAYNTPHILDQAKGALIRRTNSKCMLRGELRADDARDTARWRRDDDVTMF